jgi:hypothetical protein
MRVLGNSYMTCLYSRAKLRILQVPAAVSAIKINNVRSSGGEVPVSRWNCRNGGSPYADSMRWVAENSRFRGDCVDLSVVVQCSCGTYVTRWLGISGQISGSPVT